MFILQQICSLTFDLTYLNLVIEIHNYDQKK